MHMRHITICNKRLSRTKKTCEGIKKSGFRNLKSTLPCDWIVRLTASDLFLSLFYHNNTHTHKMVYANMQ